MNRNKTRAVYINEKQQAFVQARQPDKAFVAGRGGGKSACIGFEEYLRNKYLPRSKFFFVSTTYNQILTKTLPAVEHILNRCGMREHESREVPGHYVIGRKPPAGWPKPYTPPRKFQNVMSFFTGHCVEFLSMDRPDLQRGGSYDGGSADEAALIDREHITKVLYPSIRGNVSYFNHYLHQQFSFYTSMPWTHSGRWVLDYKKKMTDDPANYFYLEATAYDNIDVLGEKGIERLRREMTYLEFQLEVMNIPIIKSPESFYPAFDDDKHTYTPRYNYTDGARGIETTGKIKDLDTNRAIDMSMDFGGWFNCMALFQSEKNTVNLFDALFVKSPQGIEELVGDFITRYAHHKNKTVFIYGEPRGNDRLADQSTYYQKVERALQAAGWTVYLKAPGGRTTRHDERFAFMDDVLKEQILNYPRLRINRDACKWVIMALQTARTKADGTKDKSNERKREFPQEQATHITDAVDYYFMQKYKNKSDIPEFGPAVTFR